MTPPIRPERSRRPSLDELADGFARPSLDDIPAPTGPSLAERVRSAFGTVGDKARGVARQVAQGATFGVADEAMGTVRGALGMRPDDGILFNPYRAMPEASERRGLMEANTAAIRAEDRAFAEANPVTSLVANVGGGLLTGKMVPSLSTLGTGGKVPLTMAQRARAAAISGGVQGAAAAGGAAEGGLADRGKAAAAGGVLGAVGGAALSGITDVARGGGRVARGLLLGPDATGGGGAANTAAGAVSRETSPGDGPTRAAEQLLRLAQQTGRSIDDLLEGDEIDTVAERLGDMGVRKLGSANRLGYRAPERIGQVLDDRASDEAPRLAARVRELTGTTLQDPDVVAQQAKEAVQPDVARLIAQARMADDVPADDLLPILEDLQGLKLGRTALSRAGELSRGMQTLQDIDPQAPMVSVANLHNLRQGLDYAIQQAQREADDQMVAILQQRRVAVDQIVKNAGGQPMQEADRLFANAMDEGTAFREGAGVAGPTVDAARVQTLQANTPNADRFREGAGTATLRRIAGMVDEGRPVDPLPRLFGGETKRAQTRAAFRSDADFEAAQEAARGASRRLATRQAVRGNSATAQRLVDDADTVDDAGRAVLQAAQQGPAAAGFSLLQRAADAGRRRVAGAEMDQLSEYLLAGAPGSQMTRTQVATFLREMEPYLIRRASERAGRQGAMAGQVAGRVAR